MSQVDQIIRLVQDNSPESADRLALVDAPELADTGVHVGDRTLSWCDDWRSNRLLPLALQQTDENGADTLGQPTLDGADLVWMRMPRSLSGLDEYAAQVAHWASPDVTVVAFGRNQDLTRSMNEVLSHHFEQVHASLGVGKYRALVASDPRPTATASPETAWPRKRHHGDLGLTLWAHGDTFATNRVDDGTRLLVDHLDDVPGGDVLDFGSGSGIIATLLARRALPTRTTAIDVSRWAVDSTRRTAQANDVTVEAHWADGTSDLPSHSLDAIVTNPPFHRGAAKESSATLALIEDAARVLRPGGQIWVVFNSHLPWRTRLAQVVGPTELIAQDRFYTLVRATRR
ncbi:MAG: methyltransferase [Propionibacteriaceae bacterium]|jgi:16S rRNA (guanine1207-N2)-methyltransferase|nr:methyltransferase [Propionibacteriaceae bacterium]